MGYIQQKCSVSAELNIKTRHDIVKYKYIETHSWNSLETFFFI